MLSLSGATSATAGPSVGEAAEGTVAPPIVQRSSRTMGMPDEAAMVLVGTILIAVAGAVRRAA